MKKNIHPELHEVIAHCACGREFKTRSTVPGLKVTICSGCHPFFTGATKFVDTAGRIESSKNVIKRLSQSQKFLQRLKFHPKLKLHQSLKLHQKKVLVRRKSSSLWQ